MNILTFRSISSAARSDRLQEQVPAHPRLPSLFKFPGLHRFIARRWSS